jgi:hypothetical protein
LLFLILSTGVVLTILFAIFKLLLILVLPFVFITIVYWMANLNNEIDRFLICAAAIVFVANVSVSFGEFLSFLGKTKFVYTKK